MNILWLSWRDVKNPDSGGAEIMTHETAKRLAKEGHRVTIFTSAFPGSKKTEIIDKVRIIREGNSLTTRFWAFLKYQKNFKKEVDLVIEEINTIPYFTPFYIKEKKVVVIHQLAKEYWWSEIFFPINLFGYLLEPVYLQPFKKIVCIAASNSTKKDLESLGFSKVRVFHQGLSVNPLKKILNKPKSPLILFIGRLTKPKGPQDAIYAFKEITAAVPRAKLVIVGRGKERFVNSLKKLVRKLNISSKVTFLGFIEQNQKEELLKKSQVILVPSEREGWNLVPIEANAFGSVPVGYKVPGLQDSIIDGKTGLLSRKDPVLLGNNAIKLLKNKTLRQKMAQNGLRWSRNFSWDKTAVSFAKIIAL